MPKVSIDIFSHKLMINPDFSPIKQKDLKFKQEFSLRIKEEVTKNFRAKVVEVTKYLTWLANIVRYLRKMVKLEFHYRDLNKDSTKYNFPSPNI